MSQPQNTLGFYYRVDDQHFTQGDLHQWIPVIRSLQLRWLILPASGSTIVPEAFIRGLLRTGVEPIVHITNAFSAIDAHSLDPVLATYASWGVRMVIAGDRPNLRQQWNPADWARGGLVEQYIDRYLPIWQAQILHGLSPVFPPLEPGGDYWDTAFLQSCLTSLVRRGKADLARELILGIYAWTYGKPLDWGAGGPEAWPESRPYITPKGSQDQIGFCIADWYEGIARRVLGADLPVFVVGGGVEPVTSPSERDISQDAQVHAAIAETVIAGTYAERLVGFCFYPLTGPEGHLRWYGEDLAASPSAENLERLLLSAPITAPPSSPVKPLTHYVLLGSGEKRDLARDWKCIEPYVLALRPAVGFSTSAASLASQVTIIGDGDAVPETIETKLRDQGCHVRRFNDPGSEEFLLAVAEMASDEQANRGV